MDSKCFENQNGSVSKDATSNLMLLIKIFKAFCHKLSLNKNTK